MRRVTDDLFDAPGPYESPRPRRIAFDVPDEAPFLHAARRVRFTTLLRSGLGAREIVGAIIQTVRLQAALARAAGTWRYRARLVRWLRADVGFIEAAPIRSLTDHRRRAVYFDYDRMIGARDLPRHPAVLDEARHIRERRAAG